MFKLGSIESQEEGEQIELQKKREKEILWEKNRIREIYGITS